MGKLKNMTTLKELVANQNLTSDTDIQIIKAFFTLNDMEEEGMDLFYALTKSKIAKLNHRQYIVEEWVYINCCPDTISPTGKRCKFYYCVQATNNCKVTNTI